MESAQQEQIRRLATASMLAGFGGTALEERLPQLLDPAESILSLAVATRADRWWRAMRRGLLVVATDTRLIIVPQRLLLADSLVDEARNPPQSGPYTEIERVHKKLGRLESEVTFTTGTGQLRLTSLRARAASALAETVTAHL